MERAGSCFCSQRPGFRLGVRRYPGVLMKPPVQAWPADWSGFRFSFAKLYFQEVSDIENLPAPRTPPISPPSPPAKVSVWGRGGEGKRGWTW